jgi:transcriptional regulator with XRE-family HTH domain
MGATGRPILSSPPLTPLRERIIRLWRRGRVSSAGAASGTAADPLLAAGQELRRRREEHKLSLRDLAVETRISTAVLEALERGWRDRLPEATYLRTMLPLIERRLELDPGSLAAVLPVARDHSSQAQLRVRRFTPGAVDVFTTWQGSLLYGLLTLVLIQALNLQQQRLARDGLLTVAPLPTSRAPSAQDRGKGRAPASGELLLQQLPELRPLDQASAGQGMRLWRLASSP